MFVALLALGAVAVAAGGSTPAVKGLGKGKATVKVPVDLATYRKRWIVQLNGAPLATYRGGVAGYARLRRRPRARRGSNVSSARSRAYVSHLRSVQRAFAQRLVRRCRGANVQRTYQVVLNGLAVKMNRGQAAIARR